MREGELPRAREGYVPGAGGVRLSYRVDGSGPDTVVVLHGGPGLNLEGLRPDLRPLARRHTLLYFDQRGSGRSAVPVKWGALRNVSQERIGVSKRTTFTFRVSNNDNDFFVTGNRANASTLHAVGTVTGEDGQRYHVVAFGQQVLAPKHPAPDIVIQHLHFKIQLTPIGR